MIKAIVNGKPAELPDNYFDKIKNRKTEKLPTVDERVSAIEHALIDLILGVE
jgi:hypothetical protein